MVGPLLLARGMRTPSTWSRGYSRRLLAGVSPSKLFWFVGWLQKGKARRGFCREQPGGRTCLLFNSKPDRIKKKKKKKRFWRGAHNQLPCSRQLGQG